MKILRHSAGLIAVILLVGLTIGLIWIWRTAISGTENNFLDAQGQAEWILYPCSPSGAIHVSAELNNTFRRSFVLNELPAQAPLSLRAMKRFTLTVNGSPVEIMTNATDNWKKPASADVSRQLHRGTNEIAVTVFCSNGPPALWLVLKAGDVWITSGPDWRASLWDAVECPARPVSTFAKIAKGNLLFTPERPFSALLEHATALLAFMAVSVCLLVFGRRWIKWYQLRNEPWGPVHSSRFAVAAAVMAACVWVVLAINNLRLLPYTSGFDAFFHLQYIDYIRAQWALPLPGEGWQMYQPPLYYVLSAIFLTFMGGMTMSETSIGMLRVLGMGVGITHFILIFLCVRLLFPRQVGVQLFGLILAALLPENIYVSHYVTNESLAAMLVTASFYFCLLILCEKRDSWRVFLCSGLCLGAALLTKLTAVVAVPFVAAALAFPLVVKPRTDSKACWARKVVGAILVCFCICGWYYFRIWFHFGNPFIGNWDTRSGLHWWMEPGFRTGTYFLQFGTCLVQPWYSGWNGFADGLYSTLWGDGLLGGTVMSEIRPPWNYELMAAGYLLALLPTLLVLIGTVAAIRNVIRKPEPAWFLLIGMAFSTLAALVYMNLKVPSYGQAKSFYGLVAMLPLCAFGCRGWNIVQRRVGRMAAIVAVGFGIWAMNSYASFWIREWTWETKMARGVVLAGIGHDGEGLVYFDEAVRIAPQQVRARKLLVIELLHLGRAADARRVSEQAVKDFPEEGDSHLLKACVLAEEGHLDAAIAAVRRCIELTPDNALARQCLCEWLFKSADYEATVMAGREGLRIAPFSAEMHFYLGSALASLADNTNAVVHLRLAARFKPAWPETHDRLGSSLSALKHWEEATAHFREAARLNPDDVTFLYHLARVLAVQGRVREATDTYRLLLQRNPDYPPALNDLAWILAAQPDPNLRNGAEAVQLAERACELTERKHPLFVGTLAAAYAEAGRFEEAVATARRAIELARVAGEKEIAAANEKLLQRYQSKQACRDEDGAGFGYTEKPSPASSQTTTPARP